MLVIQAVPATFRILAWVVSMLSPFPVMVPTMGLAVQVVDEVFIVIQGPLEKVFRPLKSTQNANL